MKWFRWEIDISFSYLNWEYIENCLLHNGVRRPKVIRMTGPCLPGIN